MKASYLSDAFWRWPLLDGIDFLFIHLNTFCTNNITRKTIFSMQKVYFLKLVYNFSHLNTSNTYLKCSICSFKSLLYTRISSKDITTNLLMNARRTWFINLMKVMGAFVSPNGISNHS
jgi:hypothetical protein